MKTVVIAMFFTLTCKNGFGQNLNANIFQHQIDSIINRQASNQDDSSRIIDLSSLASYYFLQLDYVKGLDFHFVDRAEEVLAIALLKDKVKKPLDLTVKAPEKALSLN